MNSVGLEALSDLKQLADGPLRFSAIHLCTHNASLKFARFRMVQLDHHGQTDGRTKPLIELRVRN